MTRQEVEKLKDTHPMPDTLGEKIKKSEDLYIATIGQRKKIAARLVLGTVRKIYSEKRGWYVAEGGEGIFEDTDGLWYAFRYHAQYVNEDQ